MPGLDNNKQAVFSQSWSYSHCNIWKFLRLMGIGVLSVGLLSVLSVFRISPGAVPEKPSAILYVGLAARNITPDPKNTVVWLAGFGRGRRATGIHDSLYARALVLRHGQQKIALVSVDLIGLFYPEVKAIRQHLLDYTYILVSSTHNHEGPDTL
ncbi:hypothetical protein HRbin36_02128 [bacterium HR36]|nr:hypothetical protein HRbin36_02128 [bacterium HR36]